MAGSWISGGRLGLVSLLKLALLAVRTSSAADLITANQSLSGEQILVSSGAGDFVLGFFSPTRSGSRRFYVGIWYGKVSRSEKKVVWVANREAPVSDPAASELAISGDGNLVLIDQSRTPVWSTNTSAGGGSAAAVVAELLAGGNLVLRDAVNSSRIFWRSIDHPTDTWLPGGKVGLNKVTGENQRLTSWRSSEDPAPGIFSLEIDRNGTSQYLIFWNRSRVYWSSGPWNGEIFSLVPEMTRNFVYDFKYFDDDTENYFTYSVKPSFNLTTRFVMHVSGQIKQFTWVDNSQQWILFWSQPRAQCDVHLLCGPFSVCNERIAPHCGCLRGFEEASPASWILDDHTAGCRRRTPLLCADAGAGEEDEFYEMANVELPDDRRSVPAASTGECAAACRGNCSCTAYAFDGGCSVWYGGLANLRQLGDHGGRLFLRLAASEFTGSKSGEGKIVGAAVGAAVAVGALMVTLLALLWRRRRRRRFSALRVADGGLVAFWYGDLRRMTKNFSEKLGGGGFGSVFLGTMAEGNVVAVKKLEGIRQGEKQFRTEVSTIGTIQHVNLVRLRGFCSDRSRRLLVYDYMPGGSLDHTLFGDQAAPTVGWKTRYQIILGIARGLAYLHESCRDCIIHCDIKPENILLDGEFVPKVADFGLAKLVRRDFSRVLTTMRGTRGYLAPEWISGEPITAKADVYSFGMMLFEIISGRRNSEEKGEEENQAGFFFPSWALRKLGEGDIAALLDPKLKGDANLEELERAARTAFWCIQDDDSSRPSMTQVVKILEGFVEVGMPPPPRSLRLLGEAPESIAFFSSKPGSCSSAVPDGGGVSAGAQPKSASLTTPAD
ncbi:unnamed protein product [Spirodela intermedia]|uniref:Receptor-like serine/threonine-protein kinase n=1 Tax=Spirodela intermedia TaxID=51605 RepID=A0A7I8KAC1_SPIIN|nr:unnamed protein product [Spirodela intermedia]